MLPNGDAVAATVNGGPAAVSDNDTNDVPKGDSEAAPGVQNGDLGELSWECDSALTTPLLLPPSSSRVCRGGTGLP